MVSLNPASNHLCSLNVVKVNYCYNVVVPSQIHFFKENKRKITLPNLKYWPDLRV